MEQDLTTGNITGKLLLFALPLMVGNVLQQFYNLVDTWVVGKFIGADALAAVGSSYTLMTFLTSILLGLCMGSSAYFAIQYGKKDFGSLLVCLFARPLMEIFIRQEEQQVIAVGVEYLRIEAAFYFGIGLLFMLYGYYRAIEKPGIWAAIPIGWFLADLLGVGYFIKINKSRSDIRKHD